MHTLDHRRNRRRVARRRRRARLATCPPRDVPAPRARPACPPRVPASRECPDARCRIVSDGNMHPGRSWIVGDETDPAASGGRCSHAKRHRRSMTHGGGAQRNVTDDPGATAEPAAKRHRRFRSDRPGLGSAPAPAPAAAPAPAPAPAPARAAALPVFRLRPPARGLGLGPRLGRRLELGSAVGQIVHWRAGRGRRAGCGTQGGRSSRAASGLGAAWDGLGVAGTAAGATDLMG